MLRPSLPIRSHPRQFRSSTPRAFPAPQVCLHSESPADRTAPLPPSSASSPARLRALRLAKSADTATDRGAPRDQVPLSSRRAREPAADAARLWPTPTAAACRQQIVRLCLLRGPLVRRAPRLL